MWLRETGPQDSPTGLVTGSVTALTSTMVRLSILQLGVHARSNATARAVSSVDACYLLLQLPQGLNTESLSVSPRSTTVRTARPFWHSSLQRCSSPDSGAWPEVASCHPLHSRKALSGHTACYGSRTTGITSAMGLSLPACACIALEQQAQVQASRA